MAGGRALLCSGMSWDVFGSFYVDIEMNKSGLSEKPGMFHPWRRPLKAEGAIKRKERQNCFHSV